MKTMEATETRSQKYQVTYFKRVVDVNNPKSAPLDKAMEYFKEGHWSKQVKEVTAFVEKNPTKGLKRKQRDEIRKQKQKLKEETLPAFAFNCSKMKHRSNSGVIEHNGIMTHDYDGFENEDDLNKFIEQKKKHSDTLAVFRSPSGKGAKVIVPIPKIELNLSPDVNRLSQDKNYNHNLEVDKRNQCYKEYLKYFWGYNKKYPQHKRYFDTSGSDLARLCYVCDDPNLYFNPDAEIFDSPISDQELKEIKNKKQEQQNKAMDFYHSPEKMLAAFESIFAFEDDYDDEILSAELYDYFKEKFGQAPKSTRKMAEDFTGMFSEWGLLLYNSDTKHWELDPSFDLDDVVLSDFDRNPSKYLKEKQDRYNSDVVIFRRWVERW